MRVNGLGGRPLCGRGGGRGVKLLVPSVGGFMPVGSVFEGFRELFGLVVISRDDGL